MTLDTAALVAKVWERHKSSITAALDVLDRAAHDPGADQQAILQAHRLAGSLGSFGFPRGSELARQIEESLRQGIREGLSALVEELRSVIQPQRSPAEPGDSA